MRCLKILKKNIFILLSYFYKIGFEEFVMKIVSKNKIKISFNLGHNNAV